MFSDWIWIYMTVRLFISLLHIFDIDVLYQIVQFVSTVSSFPHIMIRHVRIRNYIYFYKNKLRLMPLIIFYLNCISFYFITFKFYFIHVKLKQRIEPPLIENCAKGDCNDFCTIHDFQRCQLIQSLQYYISYTDKWIINRSKTPNNQSLNQSIDVTINLLYVAVNE